LLSIERICGARPIGCPWKAFTDPDLGAILSLYDDARTGEDVSISAILILDPPNLHYEGLRHYADAMRRMSANELRLYKEKNKT